MSYITVTTQFLIQDILKVKKSHVALWKSGLDSDIIKQCNRRGTVSLMLVAKEDALPSNCCYANVYTKSMIISVYYRLQAFIWYIRPARNLRPRSSDENSAVFPRNFEHSSVAVYLNASRPSRPSTFRPSPTPPSVVNTVSATKENNRKQLIYR